MMLERQLARLCIWTLPWVVQVQGDRPPAVPTNSTENTVPTLVVDKVADTSKWTCPAKSWKEQYLESIQWPVCVETRWRTRPGSDEPAVLLEPIIQPEASHAAAMDATQAAASTSQTRTEPSPSTASGVIEDQDLDTESLLDNANFLSFEDWKKQNLAKSGQSAEDVGGRRQNGDPNGERRRRPGTINNALDSLGEDSEIELDFGGFGAGPAEATKPATWSPSEAINKGTQNHEAAPESEEADTSDGFPQRGVGRRRDAGTTCKERFNYASFDCAATVLKTNPQCTGSSSVLIENKDSYMLNECGAENKFLILELCEDILIDTVVLANYEFFSSIFRTFRVSVSDRYPARAGQWKELGIFEARNTREVQAFAIENPLIWARYLRIEFLTHYGNEFYCPVSLVRVHGTTMMEEYKNDGENSRAEEEVGEAIEEPIEPLMEEGIVVSLDIPEDASSPTTAPIASLDSDEWCDASEMPRSEVEELLSRASTSIIEVCYPDEAPPLETNSATSTAQGYPVTTVVPPVKTSQASVANTTTVVSSPIVSDVGSTKPEQVSGNATISAGASFTTSETERPTSTDADMKTPIPSHRNESSSAVESTRSSTTQPPAPNPTTQESFFKSVNKRLQMLESNSSLSLQYIEEQSRILRDAFNKVEKRQLAKTTTFLENLNTTVLHELREFRAQYDQVWKSFALELEHQRFQYHQELYSITSQLAILADEVVFQKRVSVIQSIFVLICFGLVLFTRSSNNGYFEFPSVHSIVTRSHSLRAASPIFGTPTVSPSSTRPTSSYREKRRHQRTSSEDSPVEETSPAVAYTPPTPPSETVSEEKDDEPAAAGSRVSLLDPAGPRPGSSPPDLNGTETRDAHETKTVVPSTLPNLSPLSQVSTV